MRILAAVVIAVFSLVVHRALAFDPEAWVVWGREAWSLSIDTSAGPSWKPLPVLFTTLFAPFGAAAPWLWLTVARAGAVMALLGAARIGGVLAAALLAASPWWLFNGALGNAEPLLVALCAWALVAHREGKRELAFALGCAAALVRVEVWPFLALYGLWLARRRDLRWRHVLLAGAGVLMLWIVPDLLASGLKSSRGAITAGSAGSAGRTDDPSGAVLDDAFEMLTPICALLGLLAYSKRNYVLLAGVAYVVIVAVMAEAGFAGNPRYLIPGLAAITVAGAEYATDSLQGRRLPGLAIALLTLATLLFNGDDLVDQRRDLARRAAIRSGLDELVARSHLAGCKPVRTGPDQRAIVARVLRESIPDAAALPGPADTVVRLEADGRWRLLRRGDC